MSSWEKSSVDCFKQALASYLIVKQKRKAAKRPQINDSHTLAGVRNTDGRQTVFILTTAFTAAFIGAWSVQLVAQSVVFVDNESGFSAILIFYDFLRFDRLD